MKFKLIPKNEVEYMYKELLYTVEQNLDYELYKKIEELFYKEYCKLEDKIVNLEFEAKTFDLYDGHEEWNDGNFLEDDFYGL